MAKRYSGDLAINVVYDDKNHYRTSVSRDGKILWRGTVRPAAAGFGPGIGYDSPQAYDEVASSAIAFADDDVGGISDDAEYDEDMTGFLIRRSPRSRTNKLNTQRRPTTQKSARRLHATRQAGADAWDVAMDAILAHDPESAAKIVASIRKEQNTPSYAAITMDATSEFVNVLEAAPNNVRNRFFTSLQALQGKTARFVVGDRVQIPGWHDDWMRGDRYGIVVKSVPGSQTVHVLADKSGRTRRWNEEFLTKVR